MPLATRAGIDAYRGPRYVDELLDHAVDPAGTPTEQAAQRQARLDKALELGDTLILQFLPAAALVTGAQVLTPLAEQEALYQLQKYRPGEVTEVEHASAELRRRDLAGMRNRDQFPGSPENQRSVTPRVVPSSSRFASDRLIGFT